MAQPRDHSADSSEGPPVLSVSQISAEVKDLLGAAFPEVWVAGEISNFSRPQSGHCYFTLKDDQAQLRGVLWRGSAARLRFEPEDGLQVVCQGRIDVYPPRGSYQLVVEQMHAQGVGALELALRKLRERLAAEGLFDADRKRPLPRFPRRIAMVTSPTGAAVHDFLNVLRRRWPGVQVLIAPVRVQGDGAAQEIAAAIEQLNRLTVPIDVVVVGRGGGSLEDLWAFNEEVAVRAVAASQIPTISAVGHEVDVSLCDLAADVRALTPSEAAERVAPASDEIVAMLDQHRNRLAAALRHRAGAARTRLDAVAGRTALRRPYERLRLAARRLDELAARQTRALSNLAQVDRQRLDGLAGKLESLSPLAVLRRGYSVTQRSDGSVVRSTEDLTVGEQLKTRLAEGSVMSRVEALADE
jgi:exodeoxyribonuclease VII large subunit